MGQQRQRSGTPVETQGAAKQAGMTAEDFFKFLSAFSGGQQGGGNNGILGNAVLGGGGGMSGGRDPRAALLGFSPGGAGIDSTVQRLLMNPSDQVSGLFAALQPIQAADTAEQVAGLREGFGATGNRFSRSMAVGEGNLRSKISTGFNLQRQQGLLDANAQQIQALAQILSAVGGANQQMFGLAQPGPAVFEPSTGQQILGAGLDLAKIAASLYGARG